MIHFFSSSCPTSLTASTDRVVKWGLRADALGVPTLDMLSCTGISDHPLLHLGGGSEGGKGEGRGSSTSSPYSLYRLWLAALSMLCGWAVEITGLEEWETVCIQSHSGPSGTQWGF